MNYMFEAIYMCPFYEYKKILSVDRIDSVYNKSFLSRYANMKTFKAMAKGNSILNFNLLVLCRKTIAPVIHPAAPISSATREIKSSLILYL